MRHIVKTVLPYYLSIVVVVALSAGCTSIPVGKYHALHESSHTVLTKTSDTYRRIEQIQRQFSIATAPNQKLTRESFQPKIDGQSFDLTPELRFREAALEVWVKYTVVLQALSEQDYVSEVDRATQDLAGSLKNLSATSHVMKADEAKVASGMLATAINVIGKEIVRAKRLQALRTVMDSAQGDIDNLSALMVGSNVKIKKSVGIMTDRILAHADAQRPPYGSMERTAFDERIARMIAEAQEVEEALDAMNTAVGKIPKAHAEIRIILDEKPTDFEALRALIQGAQRTSKFYRNLTL